MISVPFQGKPLYITVIQVCALTSNAEEAEVERFYQDLQDLLELTLKKDVLFIMGDWNAKVGSQEIPGITGNNTREDSTHGYHQMVNTKVRLCPLKKNSWRIIALQCCVGFSSTAT